MMKDLTLEKIINFFILKYGKNDLPECFTPLVERQAIFIHNFIFFIICLLACFYYYDFYFLDSVLAIEVNRFFDFTEEFEVELKKGNLLIPLFFTATVIILFFSVIFAIVFFIRYGHQQETSDFLDFYFKGFFIPFVVILFRAPIGFFLCLGGAFIISIGFPAHVYLDRLPGIEFLQVIFIAKFLGFCSIVSLQYFQMFMPYKLHPLRYFN